jgi:hypothetical protein
VWRARCEVRDEAGNVSADRDSVSLPAGWFTAPDLVARRAVVDTIQGEYATTDTVRAGQTCWIFHSNLRWLDEPVPDAEFEVEIFIDGELATTRMLPVAPNLYWGYRCFDNGPYYGEPFSFDTPGTHTITVIVDPGNVVAETDETNNAFTRELVVVP